MISKDEMIKRHSAKVFKETFGDYEGRTRTRFENLLIDQGFADTRVQRLDKAIEELHGAICRLDCSNIRLLNKYYPEAVPLARRHAAINPGNNKLEDEIYNKKAK